ncbi:hypothetical protein K3495_g8768 [Podosphaera aphanis]|nr:hypothetical protein K3495_g8768 [Podosphaera aphanis]
MCICGNIHSGQDCFYLAEGKAPPDFDRDEEIISNFKDACNFPAFRGFIRKAGWTAKWLKDFAEEKWPSNNRLSAGNQGSGITTLATRLNHPLKNENLLDNGADGHVSNNLALAISTLKSPKTPTYVQSGAGIYRIIGYGDMVFHAHLGNGKTYKMTLTNVAFAPEFLTSVVSWKALKRKEVKWNSDTNAMTFNEQLICQLLDRHDYDAFTENPLPDIQNHETTAMVNSTSPQNLIGSERLWHQRLGHPGPGSVQQIRSETVKIDEKSPKTFKCKDCALNKATKLISRRPTERARIPFERVHFDLVTYSSIGFDGTRYMLHFCDDMSRMNFVHLLANKSGPNLLRHFKIFVAYTKRQFKQDVKIFRCDQKSGLSRAFEEYYGTRQEPTVEVDSITVIDFAMTTPVPDITFDIEDFPIRNNEPNSQTNDDDKSSLTLTSQSEKFIKTESSISVNLESEVLPEKEGCADNEAHSRKLDRCAIDENNILISKRIQKKSG